MPLVFPRKNLKNFKLEKVLNSIQLTRDFFNDRAYRIKKKIQQLKTILKEFKQNILNWKLFKPKRSLIEDVFKVIKGAFSLDKIHRFTLSSVTKIASLGVVLIASLFHWVSGIKEAYKGLLNGDILEGVKFSSISSVLFRLTFCRHTKFGFAEFGRRREAPKPYVHC